MIAADLVAWTHVEVTWWICQRMIAAYRKPDRAKGHELIESISHGVPAALGELVTLGPDAEEAC